MKKIYYKALLAVSAILICAGSQAQSFRTGYFLDNYIYCYRINPAQMTDDSFFGIAVSNIELQNRSSLGISSFLYPQGNSLVTGLNSSVDAATFLGDLSSVNGLNLDESFNFLSMSFGDENHKSTIEVNFRSMVDMNLPYDLFAFLKKGGQNTSFDLSGIYFNVNAMADIAYGYSRKIDDMFSFGARLHALVAAFGVKARSNDMSVSLSDSEIAIKSDMDITSAGLLKLGVKDGAISLDDTGVSMASGLGGYGAALDLGVLCRPIDGLEVSLSVSDLGGIYWKNNVTAKAESKTSFTGGNISFEGGKISTDLEDALTTLTECVNVKDLGATSGFEMMPMTLAAGARYHMPFYKGLSAGLLATYHTGKYTSWYDLRVGATITPAKIISLTGNVGTTTFGPTFGAAFNAHLGPIDLTLGADSYLGKMAKIAGVPVPLNKFTENVHIGLAFSF